LGLWESLVRSKDRKCKSYKIKLGQSERLEEICNSLVLGTIIFNRDYFLFKTYERIHFVDMPFIGMTADGHYIYQKMNSDRKGARVDVSPQGETATFISYNEEFKPERIMQIIEFQLEEY
jgi:hypothetical protein